MDIQKIIDSLANINTAVVGVTGVGLISVLVYFAKKVVPKLIISVTNKQELATKYSETANTIIKALENENASLKAENEVTSQKLDVIFSMLVTVTSNSTLQKQAISQVMDQATIYKNIGLKTIDKLSTSVIKNTSEVLDEAVQTLAEAKAEVKETPSLVNILMGLAQQTTTTTINKEEGV